MSGNLFVFLLVTSSTSMDLLLSLMIPIHIQFRTFTPQWGDVDTFVISKGSQFRPPAPPGFGDFSEYTDALGNVSTNDAFRNSSLMLFVSVLN